MSKPRKSGKRPSNGRSPWHTQGCYWLNGSNPSKRARIDSALALPRNRRPGKER